MRKLSAVLVTFRPIYRTLEISASGPSPEGGKYPENGHLAVKSVRKPSQWGLGIAKNESLGGLALAIQGRP